MQTYTQVCALTTLTGLMMPKLLDDWHQVLPEYEEHCACMRQLYNKLKADLYALQADIEERNCLSRRYPFRSFQPDKLEASLSL